MQYCVGFARNALVKRGRGGRGGGGGRGGRGGRGGSPIFSLCSRKHPLLKKACLNRQFSKTYAV
ncbi:hypothetical protein, partial [Crocosphaera watsonii]|uniref:hypothetical protein n=1 Tax=Crocosphaera watsonii TaxID=263511 RepID=UPI0006517FAF